MSWGSRITIAQGVGASGINIFWYDGQRGRLGNTIWKVVLREHTVVLFQGENRRAPSELTKSQLNGGTEEAATRLAL